MIGTISFPMGDNVLTASMEDDGSWKCDEPFVAEFLHLNFRGSGHSPALGAFGAKSLHDAAEYLGGESKYESDRDRLIPEQGHFPTGNEGRVF